MKKMNVKIGRHELTAQDLSNLSPAAKKKIEEALEQIATPPEMLTQQPHIPPATSGTSENLPPATAKQQEVAIATSTPVAPETMGFTSSDPMFLINLFQMISLKYKFPEFILHFDEKEKKVWWANKDGYITNFGFFMHDFVDDCWGNGTIGVSSKRFYKKEVISMIRSLKKRLKGTEPLPPEYNKITFWGEPKTKRFGIKLGDIGSTFEQYSQELVPIEHIRKSLPKIPALDDDYIPQMKQGAELLYGGEFMIRELKGILKAHALIKTESPYWETDIPLTLAPVPKSTIRLIIGDLKNPKNGACYINLMTNPSTLKPPPIGLEHIISRPLFKPVVESYTGVVSMRFPVKKEAPIYLMKKERKDSGGLFVSGVLIGKVPPENVPEKLLESLNWFGKRDKDIIKRRIKNEK